jgi:putative endonuclease
MTKGGRGEQIAVAHLERNGYGIVARNVRSRWGEVDIVASRGEDLAFVEVKCWDALGKDSLEQSIGATKQRRIRRTAEHFLAGNPSYRGRRVRFDVIFVQEDQAAGLDHLEGAF